MALLYPINIDTSPEEVEFQNWCVAWKMRHCAKIVGEFQAMEIFRESLPDLFLSKIASNEDVENFSRLLGLLRKFASGNYKKLDIERARNIPIMSVVEQFTGNVRNMKIPCPSHADKTPSLHIYEQTNTWKCFSCGKGSSVIDLVMIFLGKPFKESVLWLLSGF